MAMEMVSITRAEYEELKELKSQNEKLSRQVEWLLERLRLGQKKRFGASSEKLEEELSEGQLSLLFNEAEAYAAPEEPEKTTVAEHTRSKRSSRLEEALPEGVPVEVVEHRLSEEERECPACGETMEEIGKEVRRTLVIIPARVSIREDRYYTYACRKCQTEGTETPIKKAEKEPSVIPGSHASPEAIAHIMVQKFQMASPLYRQEQEWERQGVKLSRQTMSNWLLRVSACWLEPVYRELHRLLVEETVLHADETTLRVLSESGLKAYMWLYRTGRSSRWQIVLYDYQPNRKGEHAEKFLEGFSGYLHADGYQGYHRLPEGIRVAGCWAHARRKFDEALNSLPPDKREGAEAFTGLKYCNSLFAWEKQFAELSPEERYRQRQEKEKPILDALLAWAGSVSAVTAPKSALGRALHYLREQWPYLTRYLEDGRLELSNNRAERSIKPFVIGRKNFLFANTALGAKASAVIYSLIETAKENGLDPYRYLIWLLDQAPKLSRTDRDWAQKLLPLNAPEECRSRKQP